MKTFKLYILILQIASLSVLTGCNVMDQEYYAGFDTEAAFSSPERIASSLIGVYDGLQHAEFGGGRMLIFGDIRGNDVSITTFFGQMSVFSNTSSDATTENGWYGAYRTIFDANLFLQNLEGNKHLISDSLYRQYVADAKFVRSVVYFYAVNLWGQTYGYTEDASHLGVPLSLFPLDGGEAFTEAAKLPRATVHDVYQQLIEDLEYAELYLPNERETAYESVALATIPAAQALLARIYLYMGRYSDAIRYVEKVEKNNRNFKLNEDVEAIFRDATAGKESIFFVAHNLTDNPNTNNALGQHYSPSKRGDISISPDYVSLMDTIVDARYKKLVIKQGGAFWTTKYIEVSDWVPVLRFSEMQLIKAEALVRTKNAIDEEAITLLSNVSTRSGARAYSRNDFSTVQQLLDTILKERKIELAFEGQGSFDFFRQKKGIPARGVEPALSFPNNKFVLPIPLRETQMNQNLEQNPGY